MDSYHLSCLTFPTGSAVIYISINETMILMWNSSANNQSKIHASLHSISAQYFSAMKNRMKGFYLFIFLNWHLFWKLGKEVISSGITLADVAAHGLNAPGSKGRLFL